MGVPSVLKNPLCKSAFTEKDVFSVGGCEKSVSGASLEA